jgi:hypothetical protein
MFPTASGRALGINQLRNEWGIGLAPLELNTIAFSEGFLRKKSVTSALIMMLASAPIRTTSLHIFLRSLTTDAYAGIYLLSCPTDINVPSYL